MPEEKIEILSIELLDTHRALVEDLKQFARSLRLELGWHYLLDLTWIITQLDSIKEKRIMDAGAGVGLMQWYLARQGAEVISVDRLSRKELPLRFRSRFRVKGVRPGDLASPSQVIKLRFSQKNGLQKITAPVREMLDLGRSPTGSNRVLIYNQDLSDLADIPDASLDAIVAVSALEHNTQEGLAQVVPELMRTLKSGGALFATLTAASKRDWWHAESSAWCYTDSSLRKIFDLPPDTPSNYDQYDQLFAALYNCAELRDNLAGFYYQSAQTGMPRGAWDPKYQPVGVCKIKTSKN
jgi:SAM-dependent methyltransferase